ncbi:CPBP family intramembrane glutamic endopeptidase [Pseudomonas sp. HR96]|uniref:CPBP family intramembrane glutamic endopeptidase n=1 Tax=Pseudomonas sp. HR96 TaxID=1027966 RepID=UPI002A749C75|nr:CPBP family intramembrane glutamic endopeptidase [Pseudomonas sp. HR96]WPP01441.1 CPBP family intramembrane glutamic endopeptidase [Pseudomonas sp. HR96]
MQYWRGIALVLLSLGYAMAWHYGHLGKASVPVLVLLVLLGLATRHARVRPIGHAGFVLVGMALGFHALPGFDNALVIDQVTLSPDAPPFSMNLNLDKPLIGFWLLLFCPWVIAARPWRAVAAQTPVIASLTMALVFGLALLIGAVAWAPKWPQAGGLWVANNLLLVSLTEELLFRGYLLSFLQKRLQPHRHGALLAVLLSSLLFGLAHLGGGWAWFTLATLAGIGYGVAWQRGGLACAVLCHFCVNLLHFTLFSYPLKL